MSATVITIKMLDVTSQSDRRNAYYAHSNTYRSNGQKQYRRRYSHDDYVNSKSDVLCWYCGESNHMSKNYRHGDYILCNKCKEYGHKAKHCSFSVIGQDVSAVKGDSSKTSTIDQHVKSANMHKKSRHHRGGQNKTKSGKKFKKLLFRIDYLNIRDLKGKIQEVNKHLEEKSPDVFCLVETFLKTDNKSRDLHDKYRWIGKCRKLSKDKGGIGICINDKVTVLDVNLVGSKDDGFERLWVLTRINDVKTAVGAAYFPSDGIDKPHRNMGPGFFSSSILSIKCASTTYMNPFDMLRFEINAFMNYAPMYLCRVCSKNSNQLFYLFSMFSFVSSVA